MSKFKFGGMFGEVYEYDHYPFTRYERSQDDLTQAELQFLIKMLSEKLSELEDRKIAQKVSINYFWGKSNKEDETGDYAFKRLNEYKDSNRKLKAKHKKLSAIQAKLKKQAGK